MILVNKISKSFGSVDALKNLSLEIKPGQIVGVLGPNGCGKSTLVKSILGLVIPDSGEILIGGQEIKKSPISRKNVGYMPQNPDFPRNLSMNELVAMLEDIREEKAKSKSELIDLFDLRGVLERPLGVLSGGTKQKVAAVTAFMFEPKCLILDEPTVGLDPVSSAKFKQLLLSRANRGDGVLLVTHLLGEVQSMVNELVFLLEGQVIFKGSLGEVLNRSGAKSFEEAIVNLSLSGQRSRQ